MTISCVLLTFLVGYSGGSAVAKTKQACYEMTPITSKIRNNKGQNIPTHGGRNGQRISHHLETKQMGAPWTKVVKKDERASLSKQASLVLLYWRVYRQSKERRLIGDMTWTWSLGKGWNWESAYGSVEKHQGGLPGSPVAKTLPSNAGRAGSVPGRAAKIPHASRPKNQNIKWKLCCNKFNKDFNNDPH